jgi:hypothetical protein
LSLNFEGLRSFISFATPANVKILLINMKKEALSELSTEALQAKEKSAKTAIGFFIGMLSVLVVVNIILAFKKGFSAISITPIALLPLALVMRQGLLDIQAELKSRN